ncbi:MAG: PEP-CTERM sorting domain-containing protein [Cyanobacteria bacterium J06643_4]
MKYPHSTWLKTATATVIASVALGTLNSTISPVEAATFEFQATLSESLFLTGAPEIGIEPRPDFYRGLISFDDSSLTGIGAESLGAEANLKVSLTEDPRVDQSVDIRFPEFPKANFLDGEFLGIDWYAVYHPFTNVPELNYPGDFVRISGTALTDGFDPTFYTPEDEPRSPVLGSGTVAYTEVPEPVSVIGFAIAAVGAGSLLKKQTAIGAENS